MANSEKKKVVTRKHLARLDREKLQRRYITIASITVVALVVGLIITGIVVEGVVKPNKTIIAVDETNITTNEFQTWIRFQRYQLIQEYYYYLQLSQNFGAQDGGSFFDSYLLQIENQLEPGGLGVAAIDALIEDVLIRKEAAKLGIEVSQEEVETYLAENIFRYYPNGTPTPEPTREVQPTSTLTSLQETVVAPPTTEAITTTEETTEPVVNEETVAEEDTQPEPTAIPPTPTPYTEKAFEENYDTKMSDYKLTAKLSEKEVFWLIESQIYREKLMDVVIDNPPTEEDQVWAHHILFQDLENGEAQALAFLERINAGEDFLTVAKELSAASEDQTIRYEDLGWFGKNQMVTEFEEAAYSLDIGEISQPVETSYGWHVIQVLGHEVRPVDQATVDQLRQEAFQQWLAIQREEAAVDIIPDWLEVVPTEPDIPDAYKISNILATQQALTQQAP